MTKHCINASGAPPVVGPYSHAVAAGNLLFVSGQGPFARDGSGPVRGTIEEETRLTLDNLRLVLESAGVSLADVIKVVVFLDDMDNFAIFNNVYAEYFGDAPPARSCVQAARLPADIKVEIEAIALLPQAMF